MSSLDLRYLISLFNMDDVGKQKKQVIQQAHNVNIDSENLIAQDSEYLVDTISLPNIENESIIEKKYQRKYETKDEYNSSMDNDKSNSTNYLDLVDSISLFNIDDLKKRVYDTVNT